MSNIPPPPPMGDYGGGIPAPPAQGVPAPSMNGGHASNGVPAAPSAGVAQSSEGKGSLPSLEPQLTNIQPIPIKKTLMIVNNFVINTADFINKFSVLCERKLNKVSQSVQRLEIVCTLLEGKLDSIPWLASAPSGGGAGPAAPANGIPAAPAAGDGNIPPPPPMGDVPAPPSAPVAAPEPPPPVNNRPAVLDDPDYVKYFKMIKMGVPIPVVKMKMDSEGFDSSYLESLSPDQMATAGQGPAAGGGGGGGGGGGAAAASAAAAGSDSEEDPESDIE